MSIYKIFHGKLQQFEGSLNPDLGFSPDNHVQHVDENGNAPPVWEVDAENKVIGLLGPDGVKADPIAPLSFKVPYKLATWGDSRANTNSTIPNVNGASAAISPIKVGGWLATHRGDTVLEYNFGVSGDSASLWKSTSRTGTKTFAVLASCDADMVYIQFGVNDIDAWNGVSPTYADQVTETSDYLIALINEIIKSGKAVIFESINPQTSTGWGANAALKQQMSEEVNGLIETHISKYPKCAVYVDTMSWTKSSGFADSNYYSDDTHFNIIGAYRAGKECAEASYAILPRQSAQFFFSGGLHNPNFINLAVPQSFTNANTGTITFSAASTGFDETYGPYVQYTCTPTVLSNGEAVALIVVGGDVGSYGGATPDYSVAIGDVLQGQARILVDDGSGGAPKATNVVVRHRLYYQAGSSTFADWGNYVGTGSGYPNYYEALNALFTSPRFASTTASSGIEATTVSKGYGLNVTVSLTEVNTAVRVRIYLGFLRKAYDGFSATKLVTTSASGATLSAGDITGADDIVLSTTANGANALTTRTGTQMFIDTPNARSGQSWRLRILQTGDNTVTLTAGSGVTLTGTMTIATNTWRDFICTFNTPIATTIVSVGTGTV